MNDNMEKMLEAAGKKLGLSGGDLKKALDSGNVNDMLKNMSKEDTAKLKMLLASTALREKLMKSPEASEIIRNFGKKDD